MWRSTKSGSWYTRISSTKQCKWLLLPSNGRISSSHGMAKNMDFVSTTEFILEQRIRVRHIKKGYRYRPALIDQFHPDNYGFYAATITIGNATFDDLYSHESIMAMQEQGATIEIHGGFVWRSKEIYLATKRRPYIPKAIRRAVYDRDNGQCKQCGSRDNLQYDHIIPYRDSGPSTVDNLQLLCKTCNCRK